MREVYFRISLYSYASKSTGLRNMADAQLDLLAEVSTLLLILQDIAKFER